MKIVKEESGEYSDVINSYYNLEKYDDNSTTEVLFQGYNTSRDEFLKDFYKNYDKRVYLNLEAPCAYTTTTTCNDEQSFFTHVYTLCPYTADWLKDKYLTKFIPIPFPYNKESFKFINNYNKVYDVIYMGTLLSEEHFNIIRILKKYNYIHTSLNYNKTNFLKSFLKKILRHENFEPTHINIDSKYKWELLSKCKLSIAINLAPTTQLHNEIIMKHEFWEKNKAFTHLNANIIPQFKPRVIESMVCKCLVLVKFDPWNVIENWFIPGEHFIYWYDLNDLNNKIAEIIANFDNYQEIIENAFQKVKEYEVSEIYKKILSNELY